MPKSRRRENCLSGSGRVKIAAILKAGWQPTKRAVRVARHAYLIGEASK